MTKEALKLALEALIGARAFLESDAPVEIWGVNDQAITAIKQALANDALEKKAENARELGLNYEPEPVAWMCADESLINKGYARFSHVCMGDWKIPVYTTKPQRTWVGLTDEEMDAIYEQHHNQYGECESANLGYERAIEAKLKEKNT